MTAVTTWRTARTRCASGCFGYHASWPLVRGAGLKASPWWHADFYRPHLTTAAADRDQVRVLIAGTADHSMLAVVTGILGPDRVRAHVLDRCPTPLAATETWAAAHGVQARCEQVDLLTWAASETYDVVVTDGLLSLLPAPAARAAVIDALAAALDPDGVLLYTTRATVAVRRLEYDILGRVAQTAAAATWPHAQPSRARMIAAQWRRPARTAAHTSTEDLRTDLVRAFATVEITASAAAATLALGSHPRRWRGAASTIIRAAARSPKAGAA